MRAIVRKTKERSDQGKRSKIRVRGRAINDDEVIRYWSRKGISIDDVIAHRTASVTPEAVQFITPVPSRVATPTSLAIPERIFATIRDYIEGSFASGNWIYNDPEEPCRTNKIQGGSMGYLAGFWEDGITACDLFSDHLYREAGMLCSSMTSKFKEILLAEDPETLHVILFIVGKFRVERRDEIGIEILRHFCALGEFVLGKRHPLRLICGWLASADVAEFDEIIARCFQGIVDHFESFTGPMHYSSLTSRTLYIKNFTAARGEMEELLQDLLGQCELLLGSFDRRTLFLRCDLADAYCRHGQFAEALRVGQDVVAHVQHGQSLWFYTAGLSHVAGSQYYLGQTLLAENNLREAIQLRVSRWGPCDKLSRQWLVTLEMWLVEMGRWSCAAEVREKWMATIDPTDMI